MCICVRKEEEEEVIGHFKPLLLNKFFDPSTLSMRKSRDGGEKWKKKKWNEKENNGGNSGHYVVARSLPPERQPLERRTLVPKDRDTDVYMDPKIQLCRGQEYMNW